jgi:hypothetical protein
MYTQDMSHRDFFVLSVHVTSANIHHITSHEAVGWLQWWSRVRLTEQLKCGTWAAVRAGRK